MRLVIIPSGMGRWVIIPLGVDGIGQNSFGNRQEGDWEKNSVLCTPLHLTINCYESDNVPLKVKKKSF